MAITYHAGRRIQGTSTTTAEYKLHTFTGDGTFQITAGSGNVDYVIIAGGGGGGGTQADYAGGGGGGAGGYITNNASLSTNSYSVVRGAGGAGAVATANQGLKGTNGSNSSFNGQTAIGGGGGGGSSSVNAGFPGSGGSGGGGTYSRNSGGAGTAGQGFAGGDMNGGANSGGGGGASEVGNTNGNMIGGDGKLFSLTNTYYAGGGGGGQWANGSTIVGSASAGGLGGGGGGSGNANGQDATANTGSGGGGGGGTTATPPRGGGAGADGIILIYYLNDGSITATGGTITTSDLTTTVAKPTNVQVGSRYEETDTRKMYNYTAPQAATDDIFSTGTGWSGDTSTYPYNSTINGIGCDTSTLGEAVTKTVTTLSASGQWVLRFKVTRETGDLGDGLMINLGSSSASTSSLARMQDGNGLYPYGIHLIYFSNGNTLNAGGSHNASFAWDSSSTTSVTWSVGDSRWIEVSHPSSSAFTTKVYSNANFTGTADLTNVASTSGQTLNYDDITIGTKWTANRKHIDFEDMQIWNGVTTAPASNNTWEEIGT